MRSWVRTLMRPWSNASQISLINFYVLIPFSWTDKQELNKRKPRECTSPWPQRTRRYTISRRIYDLLLHDKNGPSPLHLNSTRKLCPDLYLNYTSSADKVKPFQVYKQTQFTRALLSTYFPIPQFLLSYPLNLSYSMKPLRRTGWRDMESRRYIWN